MLENDRQRILGAGRRTASTLRILDMLAVNPVLSLSKAHREAGFTFRTAANAVNRLIELGIVREVTGQARNRVFVYQQYLDILNEGTELDDEGSA